MGEASAMSMSGEVKISSWDASPISGNLKNVSLSTNFPTFAETCGQGLRTVWRPGRAKRDETDEGLFRM